MVDLQSALRSISGGIDYGYGLLQGVRFGRHELVGVLADMDRTGLDAIESQMGFLEEARNDLESIDVPITWLHGRHDAWMDVERVRDVLSCGKTENRRLLEVPTGHQLRSSRDALQTFQLIAEETSEIALGRRLAGALPPLRELERRRSAELARISTPRIDLRRFWTDYLLGRDRRLGMQLLTATSAYREFMAAQVEGLAIQPGDAVVDLGAGTGDLPLHLAASGELAPGVAIDEVDFVGEALRRGADRLAEAAPACALDVRRIVADLDVGRSERFALESERYHAVLASLLISYLAHPEVFLREVFRVLRPGGRLVLSSMRRDADVSKLYVEGLAEFKTPSERARLGPGAAEHFDDLTRSFLNDASRILDMEERGRFRFWDPQELSDLVANAGFSHIATQLVFGDPPQAVVLSARRP
jgi:ubiquinone/menaquinone biosynthesis C-methylase UbiE